MLNKTRVMMYYEQGKTMLRGKHDVKRKNSEKTGFKRKKRC